MFKYKHNHLTGVPFKTITIKKVTYEKIRRRKRKGESFTTLFERTFGEAKPDILQYAGLWKDMPDEEFRQIKNRMATHKRAFNMSAERRIREIRSRL